MDMDMAHGPKPNFYVTVYPLGVDRYIGPDNGLPPGGRLLHTSAVWAYHGLRERVVQNHTFM